MPKLKSNYKFLSMLGKQKTHFLPFRSRMPVSKVLKQKKAYSGD